jgi:hypothetical protein
MSSSSSNGFLGVQHSASLKYGVPWVLNRDCREDEGERSTFYFAKPFLMQRLVCGLELSSKEKDLIHLPIWPNHSNLSR